MYNRKQNGVHHFYMSPKSNDWVNIRGLLFLGYMIIWYISWNNRNPSPKLLRGSSLSRNRVSRLTDRRYMTEILLLGIKHLTNKWASPKIGVPSKKFESQALKREKKSVVVSKLLINAYISDFKSSWPDRCWWDIGGEKLLTKSAEKWW